MAAKTKLNREQTEYLINQLNAQPVIWDIFHNYYKYEQRRLASWIVIQEQMKAQFGLWLTVEELKTKYSSYRTAYMKELRTEMDSKRSGAATNDVYQPKYEYFRQLDFLRRVSHKRPSQTNVKASQKQVSQQVGGAEMADRDTQLEGAGFAQERDPDTCTLQLECTEAEEPRSPKSEPRLPTPEPRLPKPEPRLPKPEPQLPTPEPRLPTPEPQLPKPEPRLPTPEPRLPTPEPRLPKPEPQLPTPEPRLPTPEPRLPTPEPRSHTPSPPSTPFALPTLVRQGKRRHEDASAMDGIHQYLAARFTQILDQDKGPDMTWAKALMQDLNSLSDKTREILKMDIVAMVHAAKRRELEDR